MNETQGLKLKDIVPLISVNEGSELEPINFKRRTAKIALLIGEKEYRNQGYETETYQLLEEYAFKKLKLNELDAGVYKEDIIEMKNLENSGFNIYDESNNLYKMKVAVSTQDKNIAAKKLYTKMGFVNNYIKYWFHWWDNE